MLLALLVLGVFASSFYIQPVIASGTIYIRADGSIDPPTAPIQRNGDVYTLTVNITSSADGIVVEKDNIVVNGSGFTVESVREDSLHGIYLNGRSNVTIQNTNIKNFYDGIALNSSTNNSISGNTITSSVFEGIWLHSSSNNSISENIIATNNSMGIWLFWGSSNNSIVGNTIANNSAGIWLDYASSYNNMSRNTIMNGGLGIYLEYSTDYCSIFGNTIANNKYSGLHLSHSADYNNISGNTITNNGLYGIELESCSDNTVCHNNFIDNLVQVNELGLETNFWDNGCEGNYWSNYNGTDLYHSQYQNETGSDGIGDLPYVIDANNTDHYPLMKSIPWESHDVGITYVGRVYTPGFIIFPRVFPPKPFVGLLLHLDVFVMNYGEYPEDLNLTLYANDTVIGNIIDAALPAKNSTILDVPWNPSDFPHGNYAIVAVLEPVSGETSLADNTFTSGLVYVGIPGDINGDERINMIDIGTIAKNFMRSPGDPFWNPSCDLNDDGKIDTYDIGYSARHFGEHYP